ncbi:MAG TPA: hypothetical protein V6D27_06290, partial [Vampirovibrionales bacterium]
MSHLSVPIARSPRTETTQICTPYPANSLIPRAETIVNTVTGPQSLLKLEVDRSLLPGAWRSQS